MDAIRSMLQQASTSAASEAFEPSTSESMQQIALTGQLAVNSSSARSPTWPLHRSWTKAVSMLTGRYPALL